MDPIRPDTTSQPGASAVGVGRWRHWRWCRASVLSRIVTFSCYIPIVVTDACGAGHAEAADRALASIRLMGDGILTDIRTISDTLGRTSAV